MEIILKYTNTPFINTGGALVVEALVRRMYLIRARCIAHALNLSFKGRLINTTSDQSRRTVRKDNSKKEQTMILPYVANRLESVTFLYGGIARLLYLLYTSSSVLPSNS